MPDAVHALEVEQNSIRIGDHDHDVPVVLRRFGFRCRRDDLCTFKRQSGFLCNELVGLPIGSEGKSDGKP